MEGLGNDYIYIDGIHQDVPLDTCSIEKLSNRHTGIGSDGVIVILPSKQYDFKMRMFNRDGSEAMMCGNGIRCFAKFCFDHGLTNKKTLEIETKAGLRTVELILEEHKVIAARVDMGKPILDTKLIPLIYHKDEMINEPIIIGDKKYLATAISMGNPHVVMFVDTLDIPLESIGPNFERHSMFPASVNTEFVQVINDTYVKMRVWERGSGETQACGTGACAVMYACYLNGYTKDQVIVELLGGKLEIFYRNGHIFMEGPATTVYEGKIEM